MRSVPKPLWKLFVECCRPALRRFEEASAREDDAAMELALTDFLSLPERLLSTPGGRGGRQARNRRRNLNLITQAMHSHLAGAQSPPETGARPPDETEGTNTLGSAARGQAPQARLVRGRELTQGERDSAPSVRRAVAMERAGHTSRGVRALHDEGLLDASQPEHLRSLRALHPGCDRPMPRPPATAASAIVANEQFAKVWKERLANGASPGPTGFSGDHGLPLLEDPDCLRGMALLVQRIRNGRFSERFREMFLSCILVAVPKRDGTARPVAIGESFYKMAAFIALDSVRGVIPRSSAPASLLFSPEARRRHH